MKDQRFRARSSRAGNDRSFSVVQNKTIFAKGMKNRKWEQNA